MVGSEEGERFRFTDRVIMISEGHFKDIFLKKMKQEKVVSVVDSKTDRVHRYVDNGVFLDGRSKTLTKHGVGSRTQGVATVHTSNQSKDKEIRGNRGITEFCIKEDYHYNKWMEN